MMTSSSQSYQNKVSRATTSGLDRCLQGKALLRAAKKGQLNDVRKYLAGGAPIEYADFWGETPPYKASANDHGKVVQALLECGAAIDYTCADNTPLHWAVPTQSYKKDYRGNGAVAKMLVVAGIRVDAVNKFSDTSLMMATESNKLNK
ncbi:Aste57867_12313 [Aphanomyces stellatus]|uniref:Aste57867_12313 protein n=1 Tax=Aphanomyces stellatus TaxID=120398 RepID=A0A485KVP3_9STRA|nr:hypothetical protein As57867_012267 [Aphanomyces stellatus]VFT89165.1 Aste57867_12313 [Aphanomyces stellatus]